MDYCIKCDRAVRVNYSCYDTNKGEVYICNDCESEYGLENIIKECNEGSRQNIIIK